MLRQEDYQHIRIDTAAGIAVLTLNRPESGNSVNDLLHSELSTIFADARRDPEVAVVVLTGAGSSFCTGGDTSPDRPLRPSRGLTPFQEARAIVDTILDLDKPFIAAVNGDALGLGAVLATLADVSYVADTAVLGDRHVLGAVTAGNGASAIWPLLIGPNRTKHLLLTGSILTAARAAEIGLVHSAVPAGDVLPTALDLARRFAVGPAFALRTTKASVNVALKAAVAAVMPLSLALEEQSMAHPDFTEMVLARREDREPVFTPHPDRI